MARKHTAQSVKNPKRSLVRISDITYSGFQLLLQTKYLSKRNICSVYNFLRGNTALDTEEMKSGKKKTIAAADVFLAVKILKAEKPASCDKSDLGLL